MTTDELARPTPITWLDVARTLARDEVRELMKQAGFLRARVSWDSLLLFRHEEDPGSTQALAALTEIFPHRTSNKPVGIVLGNLDSTVLPLEIETVGGAGGGRFTPSFGMVDGVVDFEITSPNLISRPRPVIASMSIKGGTGRTTTAIALALEWARHAKKSVLLVDADMEAPGISYLYEAEASSAEFSLEDLIAYAHSDESTNYFKTVTFGAQRLRNQSVEGNIFVLPLRRQIDEITSSSIRAEHLSTPDQPFGLSDILSAIAATLDCAGVIVDVRAGLVPLGANMALDPNVRPVLVTSLSNQSIRGTVSLLRFMQQELKRIRKSIGSPLLVINRVPISYQRSGQDLELVRPITDLLQEASAGSQSMEVEATEDIFSGSALTDPYTLVSLFETPDMQVTGASWSLFIEQLRYSGFQSLFRDAAVHWLESEIDSSDDIADTLDQKTSVPELYDKLECLRMYSERLISAENAGSEVPKPLVIKPFEELARRFQSDLPIAIVEGAKGTGKTLAARYFVSLRSWSRLVSDMIGVHDALDGRIVPVIASVQASESYLRQAEEARSFTAQALSVGPPQSLPGTISHLKGKLRESFTEEQWVSIWLDVIAWSCGFQAGVDGVGGEFLEILRGSEEKVVAIFEGVEELYEVPFEESLRPALRALLIGLPLRLRSEIKRPLGAIVFSRRDTTELAIQQNLDQFRREYQQFALTWTEENVLELSAWIATKSGALPDMWDESFGSRSPAEKDRLLDPLWGRKLGPNDRGDTRTREAYSSRWIVAVLSDLQGRLVPRDLVRLLSSAAAIRPNDAQAEEFADRLLSPTALRDAVAPTSDAKVRETVEEIPELKPVFSKFASHAEEVSVPIDEAAVALLGLNDEDVNLLRRHGIIYGATAPFEVPELFRRGLQLRHSGARYSVISLYQKARRGRGRS